MKKLFCYIKAVPFFLRSGIWCPHIYKEISSSQGIIISTSDSFRTADNLSHNENETVHPKAVIIRNKCVCCGHEEITWYDREPVVINS